MLGEELLTPGPGQIELSHLPYFTIPDVITRPAGQYG